jgi:hypothetical protein
VVIEARFKVTAAASGTGMGLLIRLRDGAYQFGFRFRPGAVDNDGAPVVACDNTGYHCWRLKTRNGKYRLYRDGTMVMQGAGIAAVTAGNVAFSTWGPTGNTVEAQIDYFRFTDRDYD